MELLAMLLLWLTLSQFADAYNYCGPDVHFCERFHAKHFVCDLEEQLIPYLNNTRNVGIIPDTVTLRNAIVDSHNDFRNQVASGSVSNYHNMSFPKACRMRELIWDKELAYLAHLHAGTHSLRHTRCHSVKRLYNVGELMGLLFRGRKQHDLKSLIDHTIREWFLEHEAVENPEALVKSFMYRSDHESSHVALVISDRVSRVGCAFAVISHCMSDDKNGFCYFFTCYYDFIVFDDTYLYQTGDPATKCSTWKGKVSATYPNLCTNDGTIFDANHGE